MTSDEARECCKPGKSRFCLNFFALAENFAIQRLFINAFYIMNQNLKGGQHPTR
jgi:hypothetical protein